MLPRNNSNSFFYNFKNFFIFNIIPSEFQVYLGSSSSSSKELRSSSKRLFTDNDFHPTRPSTPIMLCIPHHLKK